MNCRHYPAAIRRRVPSATVRELREPPIKLVKMHDDVTDGEAPQWTSTQFVTNSSRSNDSASL
jgi:hypothetical protein